MSLSEFDWSVRTVIYRTFAQRGSAPAGPEIAAELGSTEHKIHTAMLSLLDHHEIALLPSAEVWMANPFSGIQTDYPVETPHMTCYANCAWDALGVPAILGVDGWTRTRCSQSKEPMEFGVRGGRLEGDEGVIHLVTPVRDAWVDIGFT